MKTSAIQPLGYVEVENKALPSTLKPRPHLQLSPGDVLVTRAGPRSRVGITCLVRSTRPRMMLCDKAYRLRVYEQVVTPGFVEAMLNSPQVLAELEELKSGISDSGLNLTQERFLALQIPVPGLSVQRKLEAELDSYLSRLDAAVAGLKRVQANLKRYRASVLKAAVEGRLVPTEAELAGAEGRTYEPASKLLARILKDRRTRWEAAELASMKAKGKLPKNDSWKSKYQEPTPPNTKDLPGLPEGWCWATMDHFLTSIDAGKSFRCEERPPRPGEVGVVKVSAVTWGTFDEKETKTSLREDLFNEELLVRPGDFLFSRANTIALVGACVIVGHVDGAIMLSDKILRLRTVGELDHWLLWVLRSPHGRREIESLATGNQDSMRNIGQGRIREIRIPLPPKTEIHRLAEQIPKQLSVAEHAEQAVANNRRRADRFRQSILKWAFEGKLVDQDPNDERASVLLERIRAEREAATSGNGAHTKKEASTKGESAPGKRQRTRAAGE